VKDSRFTIDQVLIDGSEYIRPFPGVLPTATWWGAPTNSPFESLMMARKYREVWHGLGMNPEGTQPMWNFQQMALPYLPYFSNCDYYDNYIPIWHLFENKEMCGLPDIPDPNDHSGSEGQPRTWERRAFPPFPHQDDIVYLNKLSILIQGLNDGTSDICVLNFNCRYEENLLQADVNPRWFEADGHELFTISQHPIEVTEFLQQANINREERTEFPFPAQWDRGNSHPTNAEAYQSRLIRSGGNHLMDDIVGTYGADILLSVAGDSDDGKGDLDYDCTRLCFPRSVTFEVRYWQQTPFRKKLIAATVVLDSYDKDMSNDEYEFGLDFQPSAWIDLMIAFAFDEITFSVVFLLLSLLSMIIAILFYVVVRGTTRLEVPPRFRFTSMMSIIVPPALIGVAVAVMPILALLYIVRLLLYGAEYNEYQWFEDLYRSYFPQETYFLMDSQPAHYMITKIDPLTVPNTRNARMGFSMIVFGLFLIVFGAYVFLPKRVSKREKEIEIKRDKQAQKESVWTPTTWKRSNFIFATVMLCIYLVTLCEFSYWENFGTYIWYLLIGFRPMGILLDMITEVLLMEALLCTPLGGSFWAVTGITTLGADDFMGNNNFHCAFFYFFYIRLRNKIF
jgi:MFS family permease